MSRFFLLLCWATVLVSGIQGNAPSGDTGVQPPPAAVDKKIAEPINPLESKVTTTAPVTSESTSTTLTPMTPSSTTKSSTTTAPTTPPSTTTKSSTTEAPTTTPSTTTKSSTTDAPTPPPKTTPAPVTTPAPAPSTPVPPPTAGKWIVNETGTVCIIVQMAVQFNVSYPGVNNTKLFKVFDMPADNVSTIAIGSCGESKQNITLGWKSSVNGTADNLTLQFVMDKLKYYSLGQLQLNLQTADLPKANLTGPIVVLEHQASKLSTELSNSYRCMKQQNLILKQTEGDQVAGTMIVSELQYQAFRTEKTTVFGLAKDCAFDTPDVVPIAVGCGLAGLVVIVLIAYLVGRRRTRALGYLSM